MRSSLTTTTTTTTTIVLSLPTTTHIKMLSDKVVGEGLTLGTSISPGLTTYHTDIVEVAVVVVVVVVIMVAVVVVERVVLEKVAPAAKV